MELGRLYSLDVEGSRRAALPSSELTPFPCGSSSTARNSCSGERLQMRLDAPGMREMNSMAMFMSEDEALLPVEKIAILIPGTLMRTATTNIETAYVFPKRLGVITMTSVWG